MSDIDKKKCIQNSNYVPIEIRPKLLPSSSLISATFDTTADVSSSIENDEEKCKFKKTNFEQ